MRFLAIALSAACAAGTASAGDHIEFNPKNAAMAQGYADTRACVRAAVYDAMVNHYQRSRKWLEDMSYSICEERLLSAVNGNDHEAHLIIAKMADEEIDALVAKSGGAR